MDRDILIIGAGPSGLDSAAEFTRAGLDHDHVEHHSGVGGLWGIDNPTTPMYESALFISSKRLSCFPGAAVPRRRWRGRRARNPPLPRRHLRLRHAVGAEPAGHSGPVRRRIPPFRDVPRHRRAAQLPARIMQAGAQAILRLYFGDLRKLGLPAPDHRIFETRPLLNDQLIHHLRHGVISIRGDVSLFDGPDVVFADGSRGSYDLVLACTGYRHAVPYAGDLFGGPDGNAMERLYLGFAHRERPGLWAPGLIETNSGAFGAIGQQARIIAAVLADEAGPGTGMAAGFGRRARGHDVDLTGGLKMDRSERHRGYVDSHALHAALAGELEALGLDARRDRLGGLAG